jgi:hypothetical protein
MPKIILNIILILLLCTNLKAQQVQFSVAADRDSILIGEHINLILKAEIDKSLNFIFPAPADTFNNFEIVERAGIDTTVSANAFSLQQYIVITSFDSGQHVIPPFQLLYTTQNDTATRSVFSEAIRIDVYTVPFLEEEIRDIKAPVKVPLTFAEILPYLLGLIPLILLGWALYYWYKNKGKMKMREAPSKRIPPYEEAYERLRKLEQEKLWQKGEEKKYHSAITDILRYYLERRFHFNAMEQTTDEILYSLNKYEEARGSEFILKQILTTADLVKFAKYQPLPDENSLSLKNAYEFIEKTKPVPVAEPVTNGGAV